MVMGCVQLQFYQVRSWTTFLEVQILLVLKLWGAKTLFDNVVLQLKISVRREGVKPCKSFIWVDNAPPCACSYVPDIYGG